MSQVTADYINDIDLDGDKSFGDPSGDLSSRILEVTIDSGMADSFDHMAKAAMLEITYKNADRLLSPEDAGSLVGFQKGRLIRFQSTYTATTRQHFIGWIWSINPTAGQFGDRQCEVVALGWLAELLEIPVILELLENYRSDEVINELLVQSGSYPPGSTGAKLGIAGASELGQTFILGEGVSEYLDAEVGVSTFPFAGDNWLRGIVLHKALKDVVFSEQGYVWVDRDGILVFKNRNHWMEARADPVLDTLTDEMVDMEYHHGDRVINYIEAQYTPRAIETTTGVLGRSDESFSIRQFVQRQPFILKFKDDSGAKLAGKDLIVPVHGVDWVATSQRDGVGTDLSEFITVSILERNATSVTIGISISRYQRIFITNLQIRGTKLSTFNTQSVISQDEQSQLDFKNQPITLKLPLIAGVQEAQDIANWIILTQKDPVGRIASLTFRANKSDAHMTRALARKLGDKIAISETQTATSGSYWIVGMKHEIFNAGLTHMVTWILRPDTDIIGFLLEETGFGQLGTGVLG